MFIFAFFLYLAYLVGGFIYLVFRGLFGLVREIVHLVHGDA